MDGLAQQSWTILEKLLPAVGAGTEQLISTIRQIGLERVTDIVTNELGVRCECPTTGDPVPVQLELVDGSARAYRGLAVGDGGITTWPGLADQAVATVRFEIRDAVERLFGAPGGGGQGSRAISWSADAQRELFVELAGRTGDPRAALAEWRRYGTAVHAVVAAFEPPSADLGALAVRFGSDKWASFHWYTQHYERHFARFHSKPVRVLEIGIGGYQYTDSGGESLRMWQRYFPRGLIYGVDIFEKPHVTGPRIRTIQGDQSDPEFLAELGHRYGPFDIVLDDGSHVNEHVLTSFRELFPFVRSDGIYVVEDTQTSYWPGFGGNDRDLRTADTSLGMLKSLVDGLNHQEYTRRNNGSPSYTDRHVVGLHFYHNLAIIEKGVNAEDGTPQFIPREYSGGALEMTK